MHGQVKPGRPQGGFFRQGVSDLVQRARARIPQQGAPTAAPQGGPFPRAVDGFEKKGGQAPKAPDPVKVSRAQTQSNQDTAEFNAALNRVRTYTPSGSSVFSVT